MRIFLAGATGATGTVFIPIAAERHALVLHVRPQTAGRSPLGSDPRAAIFDLSNQGELERTLSGDGRAPRVDAIVSLVGTMKKRFSSGDTYESSDLASTRQLVQGALATGVRRFMLLSSVGAGGAGAYLQMKGECERTVRESVLQSWIFRPSVLVGPDAGGSPVGNHGRRWAPPGAVALGGILSRLPAVGDFVDQYRPIPLTVLCRAMVNALDGAPGIYQGRAIWEMASAKPEGGASGDGASEAGAVAEGEHKG